MAVRKIGKQHKQQQHVFDDLYSKALYNYKLEPWHQTYLDKIKKYVLKKPYKSKTLADLGAGQGYISIEMAKEGINVIACDLSKESIKNINRYKKSYKLKNIQAIQCMVEDLPLKDRSVDFIVANAILEHIPEEEKTISEWKRILKPGGRILIAVPLYYRYIWPFFWPINYINDKQVGHLRRYDLESLKKKFKMKVIYSGYTGHIPKVLWAVASQVFKKQLSGFAGIVERIDERKLKSKYGASNIIVVFEKSH